MPLMMQSNRQGQGRRPYRNMGQMAGPRPQQAPQEQKQPAEQALEYQPDANWRINPSVCYLTRD